MAKAKSINVAVVKTEKGIQLELSQDEAQFLIDLTGHAVNGTGRRKFNDNIYGALEDAGVEASKRHDFVGIVTFKD